MLSLVKKSVFVAVLFSSASLFAEDMTMQELAKHDGKNGNKAYVAVDGTIYDVSAYNGWKDGIHAGGMAKAGTDASQAIMQSPHGKAKLESLPVVGKLIK